MYATIARDSSVLRYVATDIIREMTEDRYLHIYVNNYDIKMESFPIYSLEELRSLNSREISRLASLLGVENNRNVVIQNIIKQDLLSEEDYIVCGYAQVQRLSTGAFVSEILVIYDNGVDRVLRLYGRDNQIGTGRILSEIDILMRVNHPSLVKGRKVLTSEDCPEIEYGIIVDYVKPAKSPQTLAGKLKSLSSLFGELPLSEQNYRVQDLANNYYTTQNNEIILYDFNYTIRLGEFGYYRENDRDFREFNGITLGPVISELYKILSLPEITLFERMLLEDLINRGAYNPESERILRPKDVISVIDLHEFVNHPIFTMNDIFYRRSSQIPREIRLDNWKLKYADFGR